MRVAIPATEAPTGVLALNRYSHFFFAAPANSFRCVPRRNNVMVMSVSSVSHHDCRILANIQSLEASNWQRAWGHFASSAAPAGGKICLAPAGGVV